MTNEQLEALGKFRKFVDLIEVRAMACDGPVTPFLEELAISSDAEKDRFIGILKELYALEAAQPAGAVTVKDRLPEGHVVLEQADILDGRVSQTVRVSGTIEEYERIVHADEAYGVEE